MWSGGSDDPAGVALGFPGADDPAVDNAKYCKQDAETPNANN